MTRTSELPLDAASDTPAGDYQAVIAALQRTVAELAALVARSNSVRRNGCR
jgi:hypothetical protein